MAKIAERKTTIRTETNAQYRGRPLIVTLGTHEIAIREKGRRHSYSVPWVCIYDLGCKLKAREDRALKLEKRGKR